MSELLVDFITSLDGYASAEGWPGFWGLQGPEYLAWLGEQPEATLLMGANTYRLMSGFAAGEVPAGTETFTADEEASLDGLTQASKVVFSASLEAPLAWANATLVRDDAVEVVRGMKESGSGLMSTIGICRTGDPPGTDGRRTPLESAQFRPPEGPKVGTLDTISQRVRDGRGRVGRRGRRS